MKKGIKTNLRISLRFVLLVMLCYSIRRNYKVEKSAALGGAKFTVLL